jgi:molybdopterin molybdotransferase
MAEPSTNDIVLDFTQARMCVERHARSLAVPDVEQVTLARSAGRVLARDIVADRDYPPFPRAARDGYAVLAADIATIPAALRVIAEIRAGFAWPSGCQPLHSGECVEIMTGAAVPPGADTVVMVEDTALLSDGSVELRHSYENGANIIPRGSEAKSGDVVLRRGIRMQHAQIAAISSVGAVEFSVYKRPRVAILSTGDEIVDAASTPGPVQIRNSNAWSLAAQVEQAGGEAVVLPIAPDERTKLSELIREGLKADLLLLSGGVSMGKHDFVEPVLRELGAEFFFTGAKIQPGKPVVFGHVTQNGATKYFFGLPGNPISTMVTFDLFVRPILDALCGSIITPLPFAQAILKHDVKTKTGLTRFLPAVLSGSQEKPEVERVPWQGSGDIFSNARANCYLVVLPEKPAMAAGESATILIR